MHVLYLKPVGRGTAERLVYFLDNMQSRGVVFSH